MCDWYAGTYCENKCCRALGRKPGATYRYQSERAGRKRAVPAISVALKQRNQSFDSSEYFVECDDPNSH